MTRRHSACPSHTFCPISVPMVGTPPEEENVSRPVLRIATGATAAALMLAVPANAASAGSKHPKNGGTTTITTSPSPAPTTTTSTTTAPTATVPTYANVGSVSAHLRLTITTT